LDFEIKDITPGGYQMSIIKILELCPLGFNLFDDSENFLNDLTDQDSEVLTGGLAISQLSISAGFAVFSNNLDFLQMLNNSAVFHSNFKSHLNNDGLTVTIKTYVI
jgi:hypothetical protein